MEKIDRYIKVRLESLGCDPYLLPNSLTRPMMQCESSSSLEFPHIYLYLIKNPSPFTGKEHQVHKSMSALRYVVSCKVVEVCVWKQKRSVQNSSAEHTYLFFSKASTQFCQKNIDPSIEMYAVVIGLMMPLLSTYQFPHYFNNIGS